MTLKDLIKLFEKYKVREIVWQGKCHDCGEPTQVIVTLEADGNCKITGGAVYRVQISKSEYKEFLKCDPCFKKNSSLQNYQSAEVYSRIVGYLRPVNKWNPGKRAEFTQRKVFEPFKEIFKPSKKEIR